MFASSVGRTALAGSAALVLTLTACSSSKSSGASGNAAPAAGGGTTSSAAGAGTIALANGVLVGPNGHTLYFNTVDTATAIKCAGGCASEWPPLTGSVHPGSGLDASKFATAMRSDGATQITYFGHPLYYFAGDTASGDKKGNELKDQGGEWYVTTPKEAADEKPGDDANKPAGSTSAPASSSSESSGGYTY
jgi:predicted lipoprotein with Yx(FWY)xxD motif